MSLRDHASAVLRGILNDTECAMGAPIILTDPSGFSPAEPLVGRTQDIAQSVDPDTGMMVSGRLATAVLCLDDIYDAGFSELPRNISSQFSKPWIVEFDGLKFKVVESNPDRTLREVVLHLEAYK